MRHKEFDGESQEIIKEIYRLANLLDGDEVTHLFVACSNKDYGDRNRPVMGTHGGELDYIMQFAMRMVQNKSELGIAFLVGSLLGDNRINETEADRMISEWYANRLFNPN